MFYRIFFKKFFKVFFSIILFLLVSIYALFYYFTLPKSDKEIMSEFQDTALKPKITYHNFKNLQYRKLTIVNDTLLPTLVFVHGTVGSCLDFVEYMKDSLISSRANFVSYDRVGYNYDDQNNVQESIAFERDMLQSITNKLPKSRTVVVGYSYGGPIVLADTTKYKKTLLLAPAVYSDYEVNPWLLNVYKWKATRWLVPPVWQQASKEKLSHQKELRFFENTWNKNTNDIVAIHGDKDIIVPFENSENLATHFPKDKFNLVQVRTAGHGLIWNKFEFVREQLLLSLN